MQTVAIILNALVAVSGAAALWAQYCKHGARVWKDYTTLSNLLGIITSLIFVFCPDTVFGKGMQFTGTVCLTVTLLVVLAVLGPKSGYRHMLFSYPLVVLHLTAPLMSLVSLLFFEQTPALGQQWIFVAPVLTTIYGAVAITMNILKKWNGPYPFLRVYQQSVLASILWGVAIIGGTFGLSWLLWWLC